MRPFALACLAPVLLAPSFLQAQFQEPTREELAMTTDPKAPGAAAVYLNYEEVTDDPLHYRSFYARIKVLQEKGKELATVELPYQRGDFKVTDIHARTIHPDGSVVPLTGKPEDLLTSKGQDHEYGRKVFTLPSVETGSILEYRYQLRYDDNHYSSPYWEIQRPYFVHKEHFVFTPFKGFLSGAQNATSQFLTDSKGNVVHSLIWWPVLPPNVQVKSDATGRFALDLSDIPAIPHEEWMPPLNTVLYHVLFYYKSATNSGDFWISEAKRWSKDIDHFAEPTNAIRQAAAALVAPADSDTDKARKLYKAVQALDNTDYSRQKSDSERKQLGIRTPKRAEDTWNQKSGSSQDIALLYLSMLRASGFTAWGIKVVNRESGVFAPGYLDFDQLDDTLVIATIAGKEVLLDPGEKMCPFESVSWTHSGAGGIRENADGRAAVVTPQLAYNANVISRLGDVTLDEHGGVTGQVRIIMSGQEALFWRQYALRNDLDEVKKRFDRDLQGIIPDGVQAHIDHFLALDDPDASLLAVVKLQGSLGTATSKRLLLPGFFFDSRTRSPFIDQAERLEPVDMHFAERTGDQVVYHLPANLTIEGAPEDTKIPWADQATLVTKTVRDPTAGSITIARAFARGFTTVPPEKYADLRAFYQKIAQNDQQQLVLTTANTAATSKGN